MIGMLAGLVLGVVRGVRLRSRGRPGAMASGEAEVYYDALTGGIRVRTESADTALSGDGVLLTDGDKGDVTVSGAGTVWTIADFTGDSGAGGVHGFVPAPAAGDAAARKVLHADGTWTVPITAGRTYYLDPANASDLATYYTALTVPSTGVETTLTVAATGTTDNLLAAFATDPGVPDATLIPPGSAGRHFHVETGASNQIGRLLVEVYTCLADGTSETLIRSGYSPSFYGATSQELTFSFEDASGYTITATQRLVYKVYAARVSGPATCNITVYFNGANRSSYVTSTILSPATGVTDHAAASNLVWTSSGHTGTASRLAGFNGGGAAAYYQIGVDVAAYDAGIASLTSADAAAGLPYVSAANTWTSLTLAADKGLYATSGSALSTYDLTASGRSLGGITLAATSVVVGTGAGTAGVKAATRGAVLYGATGPVWDVLALGASGHVLQSNGTDLIWGPYSGAGFGSLLTTRGDMLVRDATTVVRLPLGTSGYVIRSDGTDAVWAALTYPDMPGGSQSITADTTLTTQRAHLISDGSWAITLPTVASWTIGVPTLITYDGTTEATIQIVPNAADKVNGSARAALVGTRIVATLIPTAANKFTLTVQAGTLQWTHSSYDLTSAAGASPWTIDGAVFTDISSASSSYAAASGLEATAKNSSLYTSAASADCAVCRTPLSGIVDAWSRPITSRGRFWVCLETSKTTAVGGSSPVVTIALGGTALSNTPRVATNNNTSTALANIVARDTAARSEATTAASFTASGWICMLWDGTTRMIADIICSSSPSGDVGAASGWWPLSYALRGYAFGQDFWGAVWLLDNLTDIHLVMNNGTTGSKFTHTRLTVIREEVGTA